MNTNSYHVFNITFLGPENKRTGGFPGVDSNPRFVKDSPTLVTGAESKDIAAAAHAENMRRAASTPPLPPVFKIDLVSQPTDENPSFDDLMKSLTEAKPAKAPKK